MPSIHFNAIFSLILIHTMQYYSQSPEKFLFHGCDHQNLEDESCRLKVKAPSHGRRAKNRIKMTSFCHVTLFQPYTFSARTDVSTRASGLIIVPRQKGVCVCVCACVSSLVSMPISSPWIWPKSLFCSVRFCLFRIMGQNSVTKSCHDFSTLAQAKLWLTAASICHVYAQQTRVQMIANVCCIWVQPKRLSQNKPQYVTVSQHFFFVFTVIATSPCSSQFLLKSLFRISSKSSALKMWCKSCNCTARPLK